MLRIIQSLLLVLLLDLVVTSHVAARDVIHVFRYSGATDSQSDLETFYAIINDKIRRLSDRQNLTAEARRILRAVALVKVTNDKGDWISNAMNANEMVQYWHTNKSLQLLYGRFANNGDLRVARSTVFFGQLEHGLGRDFVRVNLSILDDEYDNTRDSHSAMIVFAIILSKLQLISGGTIDCTHANAVKSLLPIGVEAALDAASKNDGLRDLPGRVKAIGELLVEECG